MAACVDAYDVLNVLNNNNIGVRYALADYKTLDSGNGNLNGFSLYYGIHSYNPEENTFDILVYVAAYHKAGQPFWSVSQNTYYSSNKVIRIRYGDSIYESKCDICTDLTRGYNWMVMQERFTVPADKDFVLRAWIKLDYKHNLSYFDSITIEKTLNFPHQNRRSSLSLPSMTLGSQAILTVNKLVSRATHKIQYTVTKTGVTGTIISNSSSTSISWTPPMDAANGTTDDIYVRFRLEIETFIDGVSMGTDDEYVSIFIPQSVHPTVSIRVSDGNGFSSIFDNRWLHDRSTYRVVATATKSYGSPITEYRTKIIGSTKEGNNVNVSYYGDDITSDILNLVGTVKIVTTVYDERGRSGTAEVSVSAIEYKPPAITALIIHRCNQNGEENDQGEYVSIAFSSSVQALSNKNTASYRYAYKSSVATSYTTAELPSLSGNYAVNNHIIVIPADSSYTYDIYVEAEDRITSSRRSAKASTGFTIFNVHPEGNGMAFGKVAERENTLEIAMESKFTGGILGRDGRPTENAMMLVQDPSGEPYFMPSGASITVDDALSSESENPVQNKVISGALNGKSDSGHTHTTYADKNHTHTTLNGTDVLGALEQIKDYTPLGGYDNTITDALHVDIYNDGYSAANRNTVFGSENASNELTNCPPYGSGAFYAYREVMRVKASTDPNKSTKIIVRLTETWPAPGRIWINVYDTNPAMWLGWKDIYSWDKLVANGNTIEISSRGAVFIKPYDVSAGYFVFGNTGADGGCAFRPASDNYNKIGESNYRFQRVYCTNGVTTSSDRRLKKNISEDFSTLEKIFSELTPVCYEYSYPDDGKMRMGLIAQDVEEILRKYGIDPDHFAVLQKDVIPADSEMAGIIGDTTVYSLNYEGLISLNMKMIQNLMKRVAQLEAITGGKNEQ